ncbi:MAG: tRNA threonylcarbamoyladenosine dehydratase [Ignavibacteriae bacterium]|nr:MAG: tRNA threonylcarbamoyladenosine dehydratase [Ignavibacteriota bacterium]
MTQAGWTSRTRLLIGDDAADRLSRSHVLVVGQGGVGSYASEFLVRAGIGRLTIVDGDVVDPSNRNRQLPALATTEGRYKVDVMRERLQAINPDLQLVTIREFLTPPQIDRILAGNYDFVVDAIDSLTPKVMLLLRAYQKELRIVSSMGAGGKVDPTKIRIADLNETQKCGLARFVRKRLRKHGVDGGITAVYSLEETDEGSLMYTDGSNFKKSAFGTVSYLPAAYGGACASVVVRELSTP